MSSMEANPFMMDDVMDSDDLGLIDGSYNPFVANMSNMSLLQQSQVAAGMHHNPALPPMHRKGPLGPGMPPSNQLMHHQLRNGQMSPGGMDIDMMGHVNPANQSSALFQAYASQFGLKQNAPQMPHDNQQGDTSVEAYAALMGVKLESPRSMQKQQQAAAAFQTNNDAQRAQMNAQYFESLMQQSAMGGGPTHNGHNMTSMTLPAGIGSGFRHVQTNGGGMDAARAAAVVSTPFESNHTTADALIDGPVVRVKAEKALNFGQGNIGSQTLSPEMLSSMIQNNRQNSADATSNSFGSADFDYEKESLISKADKSRERNRDHSRKSRLRKKAFVECLKTEVKQLQMYKDLCEQNADLIAMVSLDQERKIMWLTGSYNRVLGFHEKKLMNEEISFFDLVHPDDVAKVRSELNRIAKYQDVYGVVYNTKHSKGTYWKGEMSARMCDQGIVITTRVQRGPTGDASKA
ncbi:Aste57867_18121 [Aphanomyces stellatus]|uniref:Aste57867_18121 protein n=1 Tax=Aphanomyces stellatus TaxID=120398 RepID=A0A485LAM1_9STRA|nr:hypothetical protein As57867_018059 [Aphanomyces stellatus]VFT94859.1 Aste57867_18121 [Aphanomyces stellatus]